MNESLRTFATQAPRHPPIKPESSEQTFYRSVTGEPLSWRDVSKYHRYKYMIQFAIPLELRITLFGVTVRMGVVTADAAKFALEPPKRCSVGGPYGTYRDAHRWQRVSPMLSLTSRAMTSETSRPKRSDPQVGGNHAALQDVSQPLAIGLTALLMSLPLPGFGLETGVGIDRLKPEFLAEMARIRSGPNSQMSQLLFLHSSSTLLPYFSHSERLAILLATQSADQIPAESFVPRPN